MKKIAFFVVFLISTISLSFGKMVNMDTYLSKLFTTKQYEKCYKLSRIVSSNRYSEYILAPYNIKYKESYVFVSDSAKYFEYQALRAYDMNTFNYFYMIKNNEVLAVFNKSDVYPTFINWADSLYNTPINEGGNEMLENMKTKKYSTSDDIPVVKDEHLKNYKLFEVYKFLKNTDSVSFKKIFYVDNKELVSLVKNRKEKDLLDLPSDEFDMYNRQLYFTKDSQIQTNVYNYLFSLLKEKRFLCKEQISEFLFSNTNFTDEEKMFVTFYFIKTHMRYNRYGKFTEHTNIDKMILYRHTVCNGYAILLRYFLSQNNIQCFKIHINTNIAKHANNLVIINNKIYFVDATGGIYFRDINNFPDTITITEWQINPVKLNYKNIKNFSYIIEVEGYDRGVISEFKKIQNKKGA